MLIRRGAAGFTLIELMVTLTVLGLLMALALPSFGAWLRNAKVRTVAQQLQDGLRLAQTEAMRRNRMVVFELTNGTPGNSAAATANGGNWMAHRVELLGFEGWNSDSSVANPYVGGGVLANQGVGITGSAAICFNTAGRLAANAATGVPSGASCTLGSTSKSYTVSASSTATADDRPLKVLVSLGGQIRICDPARTLSAAAADGCPSP